MNYLIDTNIISEVRKGSRCNPKVAGWYGSIDDAQIFLSVLTLGEIRRGIERLRMRPAEAPRASALEEWLDQLQGSFGHRVLTIDRAVADEWGRMGVRRSVPTVDLLLAATARVHNMTLATRNLADIADLGALVINPFDERL